MTRFDPERETGVPCPACNGVGALVSRKELPGATETGYLVTSEVCPCCDGAQVVSVSKMRAWKIAQHVDASDR